MVPGSPNWSAIAPSPRSLRAVTGIRVDVYAELQFTAIGEIVERTPAHEFIFDLPLNHTYIKYRIRALITGAREDEIKALSDDGRLLGITY